MNILKPLTEKELTENWSQHSLPLVSVTCISYNHEKYIEDAIIGILAQKTNFRFEVIIHDDASTDSTQKIIKKWAKKYPDVVRPILQKENHWLGKGINATATIVWPSAKGKYIAWIEGDDYWTDPLKLQKQVDFLENNPDFNICFHQCEIEKNNERIRYHNDFTNDCVFTANDLAKQNFIATASMVYRVTPANTNLPDWFFEMGITDWALSLLTSIGSKIYYINRPMSVYRVHEHGKWASKDNRAQLISLIEISKTFNKNFNYQFDNEFKQSINMIERRLKIIDKPKIIRKLFYNRFTRFLKNIYIKK